MTTCRVPSKRRTRPNIRDRLPSPATVSFIPTSPLNIARPGRVLKLDIVSRLHRCAVSAYVVTCSQTTSRLPHTGLTIQLAHLSADRPASCRRRWCRHAASWTGSCRKDRIHRRSGFRRQMRSLLAPRQCCCERKPSACSTSCRTTSTKASRSMSPRCRANV